MSNKKNLVQKFYGIFILVITLSLYLLLWLVFAKNILKSCKYISMKVRSIQNFILEHIWTYAYISTYIKSYSISIENTFFIL